MSNVIGIILMVALTVVMAGIAIYICMQYSNLDGLETTAITVMRP